MLTREMRLLKRLWHTPTPGMQALFPAVLAGLLQRALLQACKRCPRRYRLAYLTSSASPPSTPLRQRAETSGHCGQGSRVVHVGVALSKAVDESSGDPRSSMLQLSVWPIVCGGKSCSGR